MDVQKYKDYFIFIASCVCFIVSIIYAAMVYVDWNTPAKDKNYALEVSLPILDLERYSKLSKSAE